MLLFCPHCSNILTISVAPDTGRNRLECRCCPYQHHITTPFYSRREFERKERDEIFVEDQSGDKITIQCNNQKCPGTEAFYNQVQIRSADEPMTTFYKCTTCKKRWREN